MASDALDLRSIITKGHVVSQMVAAIIVAGCPTVGGGEMATLTRSKGASPNRDVVAVVVCSLAGKGRVRIMASQVCTGGQVG